jgi:hypothetical protein
MSDIVSGVAQMQSAPPAVEVRQKSAPQPPQAVPTDTVELSSAAQAALQQASDTATQTEKDADTSDVQNQALLDQQNQVLLAQQAQALLDQQDAANAAAVQDDAARLHVVA